MSFQINQGATIWDEGGGWRTTALVLEVVHLL